MKPGMALQERIERRRKNLDYWAAHARRQMLTIVCDVGNHARCRGGNPGRPTLPMGRPNASTART